MITTVEISPCIERLLLRTPQSYHLLYCQVCRREWISNPLQPGEMFVPPVLCRYEDCRSRAWNDPELGAVKHVLWLRKRTKKQEGA